MESYKVDCDIHQNNIVICKVGGLGGFLPKYGWNKVQVGGTMNECVIKENNMSQTWKPAKVGGH
jgi:hypothetical protein